MANPAEQFLLALASGELFVDNRGQTKMLHAIEFKDVITSIAAIVGMVLGIYNYIHARAGERVRLRVVPKSSSFQR